MAKRFIAIVMIFLCVVATVSPAHCDTPLKKFGRGVANIIFSPIEIFEQQSRVSTDDGPMAGITYGLFKGVLMMGVRALVGVYEIATFPIPYPAKYRAILNDPEFFFSNTTSTDAL